MIKQYLVFILTFLTSLNYLNAHAVEIADQFRADGKIYVVLAVVIILLTGLFFYLFSIDKKLKDIENRRKGE